MNKVLKNEKVQRFFDEILGTTLYFQALFLSLLIISSINLSEKLIMNNMIGPYMKFILVYGFFVILYDFLTVRNILHNRYRWLFFLFAFFMGLSIVANYDKGLVANVKDYVYLLIGLFCVSMVPLNRSKENIRKEFCILSFIVIVCYFLLALFALYTFIWQIQIPYTNSFGITAYVGIGYGGRLWGATGNANSLGMQMMFVIFLSLCLLLFMKGKKRFWLIPVVVVATLCLMLSGSRGAFVSLLCCASALIFLKILFLQKHKISFLNVVKALAVTLLIVVAYIGGAKLLQYSVSYLPPLVAQMQMADDEKSDEADSSSSAGSAAQGETNRVTTQRNTSKDDISAGTGRVSLWNAAWNIFKQSPLFGVGYDATPEALLTHLPENWAEVFGEPKYVHNIYFQLLASSGIFAFLSFMIMMVYFAVAGFRRLFSCIAGKKSDAPMLICIISGFMMILVHQCFETYILYFPSVLGFLFFMFLGYLPYYLKKE